LDSGESSSSLITLPKTYKVRVRLLLGPEGESDGGEREERGERGERGRGWKWYNREKKILFDKIDNKEEFEYPGARDFFPLSGLAPSSIYEIEVVGVTFEGKSIHCQSVEIQTRERGEGDGEKEKEKEKEKGGGVSGYGDRRMSIRKTLEKSISFKKEGHQSVKVNRKIHKMASEVTLSADATSTSLAHLVENPSGY